ncbi:Alcohol dehydrogenase GroES domain protein [Gluconacetobacter diazotrophicus PA1 5]|uniref:Zinc-binding dehydrogenase n=2 Tax=Gluconacetobacter diazotrophicus TaxID=33996 RepID=A0A7W4I645_GLUDI|nr:zinc-binding dehydrogenase [Gluconacetobacter diazotrophicus]ACI52079.1 Alcohol dehydrogenase GroES domain protein [Gluconacetobacter diazotrophicus PA1 5]MBB2156953.1 zinc-binding dehydrogenase [Gluconacetobacter diazotrophicus]TWB02788.1 NADPH:quinone reductase-like Zn-dependent oxidoreductase [Gluconacetobacter diazotrophicus]
MPDALRSRYRAWSWDAPGEPDELQLVEKATVQPASGEIVVENTLAAFNPVDWKIIQNGHAAWKSGRVPGVDGVGRIAAVGPDVRLPVGQRVAYHQSLARDGSFSDYTTLRAESVLPVPDGVSDEVAAGIPCPGLTAWQALAKVPSVPDRDVLVTGAGGAVALILAQLAVRRGWRVWVTASPRHHARLLGLGVCGAFDYQDDSWQGALQQALGPRRLFAVFDTTSGGYARTLAPMLGFNGHLVCIQDRLDAPPLPPFATALSLHEVALNAMHDHASPQDWRDWRMAGAGLMHDVQAGALETQPVRVTAFTALPESLSAFKAGRTTGKVLVKI